MIGNNAGIKDWDEAQVRRYVHEHGRRFTVAYLEWMASYTMLTMAKLADEQAQWSGQGRRADTEWHAALENSGVANRRWTCTSTPGCWTRPGIRLSTDILQQKAVRWEVTERMRRLRPSLVVLVALLGALLTAAVALSAWKDALNDQRKVFAAHSDAVREQVLARIKTSDEMIISLGAAGFLTHVDADQFGIFRRTPAAPPVPDLHFRHPAAHPRQPAAPF